MDAVPIDKYFELFKPGAGGEGGFIRISMDFVKTLQDRVPKTGDPTVSSGERLNWTLLCQICIVVADARNMWGCTDGAKAQPVGFKPALSFKGYTPENGKRLSCCPSRPESKAFPGGLSSSDSC